MAAPIVRAGGVVRRGIDAANDVEKELFGTQVRGDEELACLSVQRALS